MFDPIVEVRGGPEVIPVREDDRRRDIHSWDVRVDT
jgi:hypothetical protein